MERTHTVAIYRPGAPGGEDASGRELQTYAHVASNVPANVQPAGGRVSQHGAGRKVEADAELFIPYGIELGMDYAVVVTAGDLVGGPGKNRYRVTEVRVQGQGWDTEASLVSTMEKIP